MPTLNARGHSVPTLGENPSRVGWVLNPLLTVNDFTMAANATEQAQRLTDIGSSSARPLVVYRTDLGLIRIHNGTRWRQASDTILAHDRITAASAAVAATPSWTTLVSVTTDTLGGPCVASVQIVLANANSGANRVGSFRVTVDGTALTTPVGVDLHMPYVAGINTPVGGTYDWESTPSAGSHTWALQANGSAGASVIATHAKLTVTERP